jgi:chitinase
VQSSRYRTSRPCRSSAPTTPTPTPTPTSGSCATAWVNDIAYVAGNEVSYGGDDWTASQWNYDEAPGGAAGAWTSDGAC